MADYFNNFFYRPYRTNSIKISFKDFNITNKGDNYSILLKNFIEKVRIEMIDILINKKNISEDNATIFVDKIFNNNIDKEIDKYYNDGISKEDCANNLLNKYYDKIKINFFKGKNNIEEINESLNSKIPSSLFYNFINRINNLNIKFILNTRYIKGLSNSLNDKNYNLFLETSKIDKRLVEHEFKFSKILNSVVSSINLYNTDEISFYLGIDKDSNINIGYILDNKRINIGNFKYKTTDFNKISYIIEPTDKEIDINKVFDKILSRLKTIQYYKNIFTEHLQLYEDVSIYTSIIDNKISIVIESLDSDIINYNYLNNIVKGNIFKRIPIKYNWVLRYKHNKGIEIFYFTLE